jgi:RimJ/RimL family protein N-acetyltransferase
MRVQLRPVSNDDLDRLFAFECDPSGVEMAAFTRADPSDRDAFDAHYRRVRADPDVRLLAIEHDGVLVGTIGSFTMEGSRSIAYWIDPTRWGQGLASAALQAFLEVESVRPLVGRVADHNIASRRVLAKAGFVEVGRETAYADGVRREIVERIFCLER